MCDYSLYAVRSRLAQIGDELVIYRFPTGSIGLAPAAEVQAYPYELRGWWTRFNPKQVPCAVCIPPGAKLLLKDMPNRLKLQLGLGDQEEVTFVQMGVAAGRHRDGVRFENSQEILLQRLAEGQRASVLSLELDESEALLHELSLAG
ncbi:MAG: hypothetical protein ACRD30_04455 [Bryobacteraceae bacterium]